MPTNILSYPTEINASLTIGGTDNVAVTSTGNVGIGTTSPTQKLDVVGNIAAQYDANNYSRLGSSSSGGYIQSYSGGAEKIMLRSYGDSFFNAGNVGIGTTSPGSTLHVDGTVRFVNSGFAGFEAHNTNGTWESFIGTETGGGGNRYNSASSQHTFYNNSTAVMRIDSSGNVGIGTTSPSEALHIYRNAASAEIRLQNNTISSYIRSNTDNLNFYVSNGEKMRITSGGNVGIGTTNPSTGLDVRTSFYSNTTARFGESRPVYIINQDPIIGFNAYYDSGWKHGTSGHAAYIGASGGNGHIYFYTGDGTSRAANANMVANERMRIQPNGNVGIGTTSPSEKLQVAGNVKLTGSIMDIRFIESDTTDVNSLIRHQTGLLRFDTISDDEATITTRVALKHSSGHLGIGNTNPSARVHITGTATGHELLRLEGGAADANPYISFYQTSTRRSFIQHNDGNNNLIIASEYGLISFKTASDGNETEKMRIQADGNVGIGATAPRERLDVDGNIVTTWGNDRFVGLQYQDGGDYRNGLLLHGDNRSTGILAKGGSGSNPYIWFGGGVGTTSEWARIDKDGNVGIGTTSPGGKLDIRKAQSTTAFTSPFLKLFPSATTNTTGLTSITLGTSPVDNYGVSLSGWRYGTDGTPKFIIKMHNNSASGLDALTVDSSGNVGIGTTSPNAPLTLSGNGMANNYSGVLRIYDTGTSDPYAHIAFPDSLSGNTNANNHYLIGRGTSYATRVMSFHIPNDGQYGDSQQPFFGFYSSGADLLHSIEAETGKSYFKGNVGIGTTSPSEKLEVAGNIKTDGLYTNNIYKKTTGSPIIINAGSDASTGLRVYYDMDIYNTINFTDNSWTRNARIAGYNNNLYFYTNGSDLNATLTSGGNLGIGTSSPSGKLMVQDDTAGSATKIIVSNGGTVQSGTAARVSFYEGADEKSYIERRRDGTGITAFVTPADDNPFSFINATGEFMRMVNSNVGIGTSSPSGKLHVEGTGTASTPTVSLVNTSSEAFNHTINALAPNLTAGENNVFIIGKEANTKNSGYIGYTWNADASDSNVLTFGHWASDNLMNLTGDGKVGIGTTSPSELLELARTGKVGFGANGNYGIRTGYFDDTGGVHGFHIDTKHAGSWSDRRFVVRADSGNVGIGTTSPGANLQIGSPGANLTQDLLLVKGGGSSGNYGFRVQANNSDELFLVDTLSYNTIISNGNVGIGTTSPSSRLHVYGGDIRLDNGAGDGFLKDSSGNNRFYFGTGTYLNSNTGGPVAFQVAGSEKMRVNSDGNVGIGTTSPASGYKLDVRGNILAYYANVVAQGLVSGYGLSEQRIGPDGTSATSKPFIVYTSGGFTNERLRIDTSGNVGIGTTSPKAALDVKGRFVVDSKTMTITDAFSDALTVVMSNHTGCYVKITAFGDWGSHSSISYLGEFFLNNGAGTYNEPGMIIRQEDNTHNDAIQAQIVDPGGTSGDRNFVIQLKATATASFTAYITYTIQGMFVSAS